MFVEELNSVFKLIHNIAMWNNSHREYASPDAISYDPQKWLWQYRKGAFDTREQKRLLISPHGDGTDDNGDDYAHLWEYSLSGVAGELYVLYKGLQTATTTVPNENKTDAGRRVYISPFKYYAAGGELQFQADGTTKEVHITDNLGSVRSIVIWDNVGLKDIKSFDYKPFGELDGGDEPTKHGFATAEYDGESSCFAMGMRMYSAELGRFLSVDPLFEAMPRHTPYHYSFNSPLVWRDPSGLIPENEKDQDRLMDLSRIFGQTEGSEENYIQCVTEVDFAGNEVRAFNKEMDERVSEMQNARERGGRLGAEGKGDNGAWEIKNEWTEEMIEKYRIFSDKQAKLYQDMGKEFTCEDFALQIMIDFASENHLPFSIKTESGVFDASDSQWGGDIMEFRNAVLDATGANDLISFGNTIKVDLNSLQSGDLLIERKDGKRGNHVQIVEFATKSSIYILQGDSNWLNGVRGASKYLNASHPNSLLYIGKTISSGSYYRETGNYINFNSGRFYWNLIKTSNIIGVQWNFKKW
jgi:RHS repeat-associated protein